MTFITDSEELLATASVTTNLIVKDVVGREIKTEEEAQKFLAIISSFFSSEPVYLQLKEFVKNNL